MKFYLKEMISMMRTPSEDMNKRNTRIIAEAIHSELSQTVSSMTEEANMDFNRGDQSPQTRTPATPQMNIMTGKNSYAPQKSMHAIPE